MAGENLLARLFGAKKPEETAAGAPCVPAPMADRTVELTGCGMPDWADATMDLDDPQLNHEAAQLLQNTKPEDPPFFFQMEQDVTMIHISPDHPLLEEWRDV